MRFTLEGLEVFFPYEYIYPEQLDYMRELKHALDAGKGQCLLEMPTGTGKTVTLLSLITSYQLANKSAGKLIYCTRTVPEMSKCVAELKTVLAYRDKELGKSEILALCLSSRRNLCINEHVLNDDREKVDELCRSMTAPWVRERRGGALCDFYEQFASASNDTIPPGIYSLKDLKALGQEKGWCPYFLARRAIAHANVVVYNYQYMLDPKISALVSRSLERESIVVFDEAHNIDNVCIEALSVNLDSRVLSQARGNLRSLKNQVDQARGDVEQRLRDEYQRLLRGLTSEEGAAAAGSQDGAAAGAAGGSGMSAVASELVASPVLPDDVVREAMPGNLQRAQHFLSFMRRIIHYLAGRINVTEVKQHTPLDLLLDIRRQMEIEAKPMRFCYTRLSSLMRTLQITAMEEYRALVAVSNFVTLVATYTKGFMIVTEPYDERTQHLRDPVMQLACVDASLAMKPVFDRFKSVIVTSGTLSPLELYPKLLGMPRLVVSRSFSMSIDRDCMCPLVVTRGDDQVALTTRFESRDDNAVVRNYGAMVLQLAKTVPDGVVVFFTSYSYMENVVSKWDDMGILVKIFEHKRLFLETKDVVETTLALDNFRRTCESGRGAMFFSIARGKVAEGVDFDKHRGRCVVMIGVPYQYTLSRVLRARLDFLREHHKVRENDFLTFDALRQAAQCMGRVIRSKQDYGLMVFADRRYADSDKQHKLPEWIRQFVSPGSLNLSVDEAMRRSKDFLRRMAQPLPPPSESRALMDGAGVAKRLEAQVEAGVRGVGEATGAPAGSIAALDAVGQEGGGGGRGVATNAAGDTGAAAEAAIAAPEPAAAAATAGGPAEGVAVTGTAVEEDGAAELQPAKRARREE